MRQEKDLPNLRLGDFLFKKEVCMKKLVKINNKSNIVFYSSSCEGFIIGLKDFSVDFDCNFSLDEIKELVSTYKDKEFFISINKNIFNSELDSLEKALCCLNDLNVKVLFYDMSVLYLKNKNELSISLVWNQTHMVTNYNTCNYYYEKGCKYAYVSGEITLEEIVEINNKTKSLLLVQILGHQTMSYSRRKLLTNFYSSINKEYDGEVKKISEHDRDFLIRETKDGTAIKTNEILNGIQVIPELLLNNIKYIVIDESYIDKNLIIEALHIIDEIICGKNVDDNILKSKKVFGDNTSFLFKKTIYKVKKSEV